VLPRQNGVGGGSFPRTRIFSPPTRHLAPPATNDRVFVRPGRFLCSFGVFMQSRVRGRNKRRRKRLPLTPAALRRMGYRVYRVTNDDVTRNLEGVLGSVLHELQKPS